MKAKFLLLVSLIALGVSAQTRDKAKLDAYFNTLEKNNKFMGNVLLTENGKVIYEKSTGYADITAAKKINQNTKFRIGSITKIFTSSLIFKAIEEKKIKLTDNLAGYFPAVPKADKITIAQLLGHRSGIHNFTDDAEYGTYMTIPKTGDELMEIIVKAGSDSEPGGKPAYSNSNYVLLTQILEKLYGKSYAQLLDDKIIKPLKLENTYYGSKIGTQPNEALSYSFVGKWEKMPETDMSIPLGAGAIVSNTTDLVKFIDALFAGKVVSPASLEEMKTVTDEYGLGLFTFKFPDNDAIGHTGGIDGFSSMLAHIPKSNLSVAQLSNGKNINGTVTTVLNWYNNKPFEVPEFTNLINNTADLDKYLGEYTSTEIPLQITVTKEGTTLIAQATGQSSFPMDATAKDVFEFAAAGVVLEFKPETRQMVLKQAGRTFTFVKK